MNGKYHAEKETLNEESYSISSTLENKALSILNVKNPLEAPDFNPTEYINRLFPNEQSLSSIDTVLNKIKQKTVDINKETERITSTQITIGKQGTEKELGNAKLAIKDLFQKIQDIKTKAAQSESMVRDITQDVKSLDYAKRHLTHSVTVLKRLQMLVTAVDQLEIMSKNKQYKESAQLLQAVIQLMQHFKSYKSVPQIASLSDRINSLQKELESSILHEIEIGFNSEGALRSQSWVLHDACLVASVLGENTKEKAILYYVDLQLSSYRQIFKSSEEVSQIDNISRRYAFLKRTLKTCDEEHNDIFPPEWYVSGRLCEKFCNYTRTDLEQILATNQPDVKELLKALQMTIEFEAQLSKRYEKSYREIDGKKYSIFQFEKSISTSFQPYLWVYIEAKDRTLADMINSYKQSDKSSDDPNMTVLPSSTDIFYFYRETLTQCAKFSTGGALWDLCQLFSKHLSSYCEKVLLQGIARDEKQPVTVEHIRYIALTVNTADYCCITTSQLEEKLNDQIDEDYKGKVDLQGVKDKFMSAVSSCIDAIIRCLSMSFDPFFQQMTRLSWGSMETVGDQSDYVTQLQDSATKFIRVVGSNIANKRFYRTFYDRFADMLLNKYVINIFRCKMVSEIGAEQMLLDTHSIKTLLMDIPSLSSEGATSVPTSYGKIVNRGISKSEMILKTVMTPTEPMEGYVDNYLFLIADKHLNNFTRLLDLKGIRKVEQGPLIDMFQRRISNHPEQLTNNTNLFPHIDTGGFTSSTTSLSTSSITPSNITTSLTSIATTAASNFNASQLGRHSPLSPHIPPSSPTPDQHHNGSSSSPSSTQTKTGRLNENFRKLVMTGMAFKKDLQERREQNKDY